MYPIKYDHIHFAFSPNSHCMLPNMSPSRLNFFLFVCLFVYNPLKPISVAHVCIGMESPTGTPSKTPSLAAINCQYLLSKGWDWERTCFIPAMILVGTILCRSQVSNQSCRELMSVVGMSEDSDFQCPSTLQLLHSFSVLLQEPF